MVKPPDNTEHLRRMNDTIGDSVVQIPDVAEAGIYTDPNTKIPYYVPAEELHRLEKFQRSWMTTEWNMQIWAGTGKNEV